MSKAQRRATKKYYPPHLTGHGSRGLGLVDMIFFVLDIDLPRAKSRNGCFQRLISHLLLPWVHAFMTLNIYCTWLTETDLTLSSRILQLLRRGPEVPWFRPQETSPQIENTGYSYAEHRSTPGALLPGRSDLSPRRRSSGRIRF